MLAGYVHVPANDKIGVLVELEAACCGSREERGGSEHRARACHADRGVEAAVPDARRGSGEHSRSGARHRPGDGAKRGPPGGAAGQDRRRPVRKFYEESVLVDQAWLREPKKSVAQVLKDAGVSLRRYVRYSVGEEAGRETSGAIKETAE